MTAGLGLTELLLLAVEVAEHLAFGGHMPGVFIDRTVIKGQVNQRVARQHWLDMSLVQLAELFGLREINIGEKDDRAFDRERTDLVVADDIVPQPPVLLRVERGLHDIEAGAIKPKLVKVVAHQDDALEAVLVQ